VQHDAFIKGRALRLTKVVLGEGLLTSEDPLHRRQRRLALPAFHHRRIAGYAAAMVDYAARRDAEWHHGQTVDVDAEMMRLTLEVVGKTLFDAEVGGESSAISQAMGVAIQMFDRTSNPLAEWLNRLPLPGTIRLRRARQRLDETIYRIIDAHRAADRDDLLALLLAARDEDTGAAMTDRQVRDEAMTLFLAGHETTAVALTWTWYLLAGHPEAEAKLHAEVDAVLAGRRPAFDDLPALAYTRQVFSEAMRLFPPAWALSREATRDVDLLGHPLPRGATVVLSPYLLHRDPRFWNDPERFDPDRFGPEARAARHKFAYLPFSTGPRGCIGEQFAWTEGILVLATLARRWRFRRTTDAFPGVRPRITLRPDGPIPMRVEAR
jgi:cytochrome P450